MKMQGSVTAEGKYRTWTTRCGKRKKEVSASIGVEAGEQNDKAGTLLPWQGQEPMLSSKKKICTFCCCNKEKQEQSLLSWSGWNNKRSRERAPVLLKNAANRIFSLVSVRPSTTERTKQLMGSLSFTTSKNVWHHQKPVIGVTAISLLFVIQNPLKSSRVSFVYGLNRFWRTQDPTITKSFKFCAAINFPYFNLGLDAPHFYIQRLLENSKAGDVQGEEK